MGNKKLLILGSSSIWRKEILSRTGLEFEIIEPNIDEKSIRNSNAEALTQAIAEAKCLAVFNILQQQGRTGCIITSDQVMICEGEILEKPESEAEVRRRLQMYPRTNPGIVTAVYVFNMDNWEVRKGVDIVHFPVTDFSEEEIAAIAADPLTYKTCGALPSGLVGEPVCEIVDAHKQYPEGKWDSVNGLPLYLVDDFLTQVGYFN